MKQKAVHPKRINESQKYLLLLLSVLTYIHTYPIDDLEDGI